jgi:hypothetical protein
MRITRRTLFQAAPAAALQAEVPAAAPAPRLPPLRARWIWYPEGRTLPGTFVLFRNTISLAQVPPQVPAWVSGNSRYELLVNGQLASRGPAPCDPRYWDVDPVDLAPFLVPGRNAICAIVACFGGGDGTYVPSRPLGMGDYGQGFLFEMEGLATGAGWKALRARSYKAGQYQRWFLRALQEEFDMRLWPDGWLVAGYDDRGWKDAAVSRTPPGRPNLTELPREGGRDDWTLRARTIPPIRETYLRAPAPVARGWIEWLTAPEEYFECFPAAAFSERADNTLQMNKVPALRPGLSAAFTFDFGRELLGHPRVRVRAPAGTVVELLWVENQPRDALLLRTPPRFGQWARLVCRDGVNPFETFDYECFRWLQVLVRNNGGPAEIQEVGVTERNYAWPREPDLKTSDAEVNRAFEASVNTHKINCQETIVDNMVRERQQYAGDLDHAKLGSYYGFGEYAQPARMLRTFAQGQSREGWFPDSWPAWDRCQRLWQKHLGLTEWGPIIDHSMQFTLAAAEHYLFTGDRALLAELYPRLVLFDQFLDQRIAEGGLLRVQDHAWTSVWIDHIGFHDERDKHCALNLYWAGMLSRGLARIAAWLGESRKAAECRERARAIEAQVRSLYWDDGRGLFLDNLPRLQTDRAARVHARTLSMALLSGAVPAGRESSCLELLASIPPGSRDSVHQYEGGALLLGSNYPLNEIWRLWALGWHGRGDLVVRDLRERWARMRSVIENRTYSEMWDPGPSSTGSIWAQSNPVPIIALYQIVLGVRPTAPGFAEYEVRPQPGGLASIEATVHPPQGAIALRAEGRPRGFALAWKAPAGRQGVLVVPEGARATGLPAGVRFEPGPAPRTLKAALPAAQDADWNIAAEW